MFYGLSIAGIIDGLQFDLKIFRKHFCLKGFTACTVTVIWQIIEGNYCHILKTPIFKGVHVRVLIKAYQAHLLYVSKCHVTIFF